MKWSGVGWSELERSECAGGGTGRELAAASIKKNPILRIWGKIANEPNKIKLETRLDLMRNQTGTKMEPRWDQNDDKL